jgi:HEAT repeat protein
LQGSIREHDVDHLVAALSEEKAQRSALRRARLINALGKARDPRAVDILSKLLMVDPNSEVRSVAILALGQIGDPSGAPALREAVRFSSPLDQTWAIRSLGYMRDRESVPLLVERLQSSDGSVRRFAASALGDIGDRAAMLPLIEALDDPFMRRSAAAALAKLGDSRALAPVRLAHRSAGGLAKRRIARSLTELEARLRSEESSRSRKSVDSVGALERKVSVLVSMIVLMWDAFKIPKKKQGLAEAIEQGNRLLTSGYEQEPFAFLEQAVSEFPDDPRSGFSTHRSS